MRTWPRLSNVIVSLALGAAAVPYGVRFLRTFHGSSQEPGLWDLVAAVASDPRFLTAIVLTTVLVRMALRRERVLPEILRMGTYQRVLLDDVIDAARSMILPAIAILAACVLTAATVGLPIRTLHTNGSATGDLIRAGMSPLVGIGLQIIFVGFTLFAMQTLLAAIRIVCGSVIPVVVAALVLWAWGGASVLQLQTVITRNSGVSIAESLQEGVTAASNSGTYLDLLIALEGGAVRLVVITLAVVVAASFTGVWLLDQRIVHSRRTTLATSASTYPTDPVAARHHPSHEGDFS